MWDVCISQSSGSCANHLRFIHYTAEPQLVAMQMKGSNCFPENIFPEGHWLQLNQFKHSSKICILLLFTQISPIQSSWHFNLYTNESPSCIQTTARPNLLCFLPQTQSIPNPSINLPTLQSKINKEQVSRTLSSPQYVRAMHPSYPLFCFVAFINHKRPSPTSSSIICLVTSTCLILID